MQEATQLHLKLFTGPTSSRACILGVDIWCTSATMFSFLLRNLAHVWWNNSVNPTNTQQVAMTGEFNSKLQHSSEPTQM